MNCKTDKEAVEATYKVLKKITKSLPMLSMAIRIEYLPNWSQKLHWSGKFAWWVGKV